MGADAAPRRVRMLIHQARLVLEKSADFAVFVGGLGSGKTRALAHKAISLAVDNPGKPGVILERSWPELRDILFPCLGVEGEPDGVLAEWQIPFTYRKSAKEVVLHLPGGDTPIWLRQADRIRPGPNIAWLVADEAGLLEWPVLRQWIARVRLDSANYLQIVLGGTPEGFNHFYEYAEGETRKHLEEKGAKFALIRASTTDNPFLPANYVALQLAGFTEEELEAYEKGLFVPPSGRVYTRFQRAVHVQPCLDPTVGRPLMFCDFNVAAMVWLLALEVNGRVHVFDEIVRQNTDTFDQTAEALHYWGRLFNVDPRTAAARVTVITDAAGSARSTSAKRSDTQILRDHGFQVRHPSRNPFVEDRVFSVQRWLQESQLLVDPKCRQLVKSLEQQPRTKTGEPEKRQGIDGLDHANDALGYGLHYLRPATRPRGNARVLSSYS